MSLIVYAVCRTGSFDPSLLPAGVGGGRVHAICTERCCAIFSEAGAGARTPTGADFKAFDRVVEGAHLMGPTLPVRYGTFFEDDAVLSRTLRQRGDELVERLARVAGCVEVHATVRRAPMVVTRPARTLVHATAGTGALKAETVAFDAFGATTEPAIEPSIIASRVAAELEPLAEAIRVENDGAMRTESVLRCLVRREMMHLLAGAFDDLREELGFEGRVGGASPCYTFATVALA